MERFDAWTVVREVFYGFDLPLNKAIGLMV